MSHNATWTTHMNYFTNHERDRQLRKVAILVSSLDEKLAEQILADLPAADAQAVRTAVDRLDHVDREEEDSIFDEFRSSTHSAKPTNTDGVELDASLLARIEEQEAGDSQKPAAQAPNRLSVLSDAEATTIVDALSREHPQTVAIVISRLDDTAAAKILTMLPPHLQVDVLKRLAELDPADEHSVQVVESHLAEWINHQRERKQRKTAGAELVQRILQGTPEDQRAVILSRLGSRLPEVARRFAQRETSSAQSVDSQSRSKVSTDPHSKSGSRGPISRPPVSKNSKPSIHPDIPTVADPLGELERADDAALLAALTQTDRQVVTLALAGASEELMKRILRRLPRRQAKDFRKRLRDVGPTRLSDMLSAQQQLAFNARSLA